MTNATYHGGGGWGGGKGARPSLTRTLGWSGRASPLPTWNLSLYSLSLCQINSSQILKPIVRMGLRHWCLTTMLSCLPWGQRPCQPPWFPNCYFNQAQVNVSVPTQPKGSAIMKTTPPSWYKKKEAENNLLAVALPCSWLGHRTHCLEKFHLWFSITKLLI